MPSDQADTVRALHASVCVRTSCCCRCPQTPVRLCHVPAGRAAGTRISAPRPVILGTGATRVERQRVSKDNESLAPRPAVNTHVAPYDAPTTPSSSRPWFTSLLLNAGAGWLSDPAADTHRERRRPPVPAHRRRLTASPRPSTADAVRVAADAAPEVAPIGGGVTCQATGGVRVVEAAGRTPAAAVLRRK